MIVPPLGAAAVVAAPKRDREVLAAALSANFIGDTTCSAGVAAGTARKLQRTGATVAADMPDGGVVPASAVAPDGLAWPAATGGAR